MSKHNSEVLQPPAVSPHSIGNSPKVSIILPTYQRGPLIRRSILSILAQTWADFELLIVDDGSTDSTAAEVAHFVDPRIRYLPQSTNRGAAAARNVGIAQAGGAFLAFQDSDDEWLPMKLEKQMQSFATSAFDVGVVYCDMQRIRLDGSTEYHRSPDVAFGRFIDPETRFYQVCKLGIQSAVIRRSCFAEVGGFNESFPVLEDMELFIRMSRRHRFLHLHMPLVRYYETIGLSKNMPGKLVARALLLQLYGRDLERDDAAFVSRERASLEPAASSRTTK